MNSSADLANSVKIKMNKHGISIIEKDTALELVGTGRSAVVFKIKTTDKALKVFYPNSVHIALEEAEIYEILQGNPYFPKLYEAGENFLLIDYIDGNTLFDCLAQGIQIDNSIIKETDKALLLAKQKGLNPSDIHLRNIILTTEGKVKLIDVARFRQTKDCHQWGDLKNAFFKYYNKDYFPKKIPATVLNTIAFLYRKKIVQVTSNKIV